jgi:antitoxin ParD1/3/4
MPTRNVVLTEHQAQLIDTLVGSGRYQNASEILREGLRMVERREIDDAARLDALRAAARVGTDALERGAFEEFSTAAVLGDHLDALAARVRTGKSA